MVAELYRRADLYDLVHGTYAPQEVLDFYHEQAVEQGAPVLELACGSGRILVPLADAGIDISGLDVTPEMLALARRKAAAAGLNVPLHQGDMRDFTLNRRFQTIIIAGNSLQHLMHRRDVARCLDAVRAHLAPEGKLILEVFNPSLTLLARDPAQRYPVGDYRDANGALVHVTEEVRYDTATQINHLRWFFEWPSEQRVQEVPLAMRQFFPQELSALLAFGGFGILAAYGDYDRRPLESESNRQLLVCRVSTDAAL